MANIIDAILRLKDNFTPTLTKAQDGLTKYAKQAQRLGKDVQKVGKNIEGLGKTLTASVTLPIVGVGTASLKTAMDFDKAMSKVQGIAMATAEDYQTLRKKALEMGATTMFSATQSAEAMSYMAMAGWKTEQMVEGIAGVMNLAAASGEDLALVTDILTDALTGFGMVAGDAGRFADILAAASSNANTNVAMMGETFKYVTPIAGALKYTAEDTALAIGLMANAGIKSSQAGTSLRTMMSKLTGVIEITGKSLGKYIVEVERADGSIAPFRETLIDLREAFKGLTDAEKVLEAESLVGREAMSGLLSIMNASDADFQKLADAIDSSAGAAQKMSKIMQSNLAGQITIILSGIESLAIAIGDRLVPYAEKLATFTQMLVDKFNGLSDAQKDQIIKWGFILAVIPLGIKLFGSLVSGVGKMIFSFGKFGKAVKGAGSVMKVIFSPANKIVLLIAAIALAAFLLIKYWEPIKGFFIGVFDAICSYAQKLGIDFGLLGQVWNQIKEVFVGFCYAVMDVAVQVWNALQPWVIGIAQAFYILGHNIMGAIEGFMSGVGDFINGVVLIVSGLLSFITGVFTGGWEQAWGGVVDVFKGIFTGIVGICKSVINTVIGFINGGIRGINKITNMKLPDALGGAEIGFKINEIPMLYKGTDNWKGGTAMIHDRGAEIVDLPSGSRVIPHDESLKIAKSEGMKQGTRFSIEKLADTIVVREDADIDKIANALYGKFKKHALNMA